MALTLRFYTLAFVEDFSFYCKKGLHYGKNTYRAMLQHTTVNHNPNTILLEVKQKLQKVNLYYYPPNLLIFLFQQSIRQKAVHQQLNIPSVNLNKTMIGWRNPQWENNSKNTRWSVFVVHAVWFWECEFLVWCLQTVTGDKNSTK